MNTIPRLSLTRFIVSLAIAIGSTSAFAKVSAEELLCFQPGDTAINEENIRTLLRLRDKALQLGRLDGIFITTVTTTPAVEDKILIQQRDSLIKARLAELGLRHNQFSATQFLTDRPEDEGCSKGQVPVAVTLLFAEPTELKNPAR